MNARRGRLEDFEVSLPGAGGFLPASGKFLFPADYGAARRAGDHLKYSAADGANQYLLKILMLAKTLGHWVRVVVPPVRSDYRAAIGRAPEQVFRSLLEIEAEVTATYDLGILNLYDHLLPTGEGPALLTRKVSRMLGKT